MGKVNKFLYSWRVFGNKQSTILNNFNKLSSLPKNNSFLCRPLGNSNREI